MVLIEERAKKNLRERKVSNLNNRLAGAFSTFQIDFF